MRKKSTSLMAKQKYRGVLVRKFVAFSKWKRKSPTYFGAVPAETDKLCSKSNDLLKEGKMVE